RQNDRVQLGQVLSVHFVDVDRELRHRGDLARDWVRHSTGGFSRGVGGLAVGAGGHTDEQSRRGRGGGGLGELVGGGGHQHQRLRLGRDFARRLAVVADEERSAVGAEGQTVGPVAVNSVSGGGGAVQVHLRAGWGEEPALGRDARAIALRAGGEAGIG